MCRIIALLALLAGNLAERCVAISRACERSNNMFQAASISPSVFKASA